MAGPADEIIVRLTADASQLESGLSGATSSVQAAQEAMASSGESAADAMAVASQTAAEATVKSLERIRLATSAQIMQWRAAASEITATSQAQAEAVAASQQEIEASVVETVAPIDAATEEIAAAPLTVAEAYQEMLASVQASLGEYASSFDVLYAVQDELDAALASGTLTSDAYAQSLALLDAQTDALNASIAADVEAINAQTVAMQESAVATTEDTVAADANTEATVANTEAKKQNVRFHGIYGTLGQGLTALTSPLGLAAGGIALLGAGAAAGVYEEGKLNDAILATGDAAGVTVGQVESMASALTGGANTTRQATEALTALIQSGRITSSTLQEAAGAVVNLANMTGESIPQAAKQIESLAQNPLQAVVKLNDQYHFLTVSQFRQIEAFAQAGEAAKAYGVALGALSAAENHAAQQSQQDLNYFGRSVQALLNEPSMLWSSIESLGQKSSKADQLASVRGYLEHQAKLGTVSFSEAAGHVGFSATAAGAHNATVAAALAEYNKLTAELTSQSAALSAHAAAVQKTTAAIDEMAKAEKHAASHHAKAPYIAAGDSGWNVGALSPDDRAMMAVEERQIAARQKAQQVADEVQKTQIGSQASHSTALLDMQRSHVQALAGMGSISASSEIAQEQSLADQIYAIKLNEYQRELALAKDKPTQQASINAEIIRAQDTLAQTTQTLADKSAADQIKTAESVVAPITQAFGGIVTGYIQGTLTMQQAEQRMGSAILAEAVNRGVQMITHHIAVEEAKTLATAAGTAQRLALNVVAEGEALAVHAAAAIKWILTEAAKAAAGAFSAMAGIPYVGPILAVAAGAAMLAEVGGLVGHVASAEGGWERVPFDGAPAVLHKDEMVLPAELADGVRNMSGSGGQTQIHIHTFDPVSFEQYLKRNPKALLNALGHAGRTGHAFA